MKIIFLDFDGVINSLTYATFEGAQWNSSDPAGQIDYIAIGLLNKLIGETSADVVISSTWRLYYSLDQMKDFLKKKGFIGNVIGKTPDPFVIDTVTDRRSVRGHEIQSWIDFCEEKIDSFVILDDNSDMAHLIDKLVQTTWEFGLQEEHLSIAKNILNECREK
jgi:hypothetical protein